MATSSAGGGPVVAPDGSELAKDTTADRAADAAETLAGAVDGNAVRTVAVQPTFITAPPVTTEAPATRIVGDGLDRDGNPILRVEIVPDEAITVIQGDGSGDPQDTPPWLMQTTKDVGGGVMEAKPIATEETAEAALAEMADDATTTDVQEVRDRLPSALDGGRLAARLDVGTETAPLVALTPAYGRTSFGQIRVAQRSVLFENVQAYGLDLRAWAPRTSGAGSVAFDTSSGMTNATVSGASGDVAEISTNTHFPYEPGATSHAIMTLAQSDAGHANQTREWGFGTADDGFFFRLVGTDLYVVRRASSSGAATDANAVLRSSWSGDKLDGTGPSGRTLDLAKINQFEIDYQWLSAGVVRFWINGNLVHTLDLRGAVDLPATRTGQLPLRVTITNTGASSIATISYVCSVVYMDGGTTLRFVPGSHSLSAPKTGVGTTFTPVVAFRMAATYLGRPNRKIVLPALARVSNASGRGTVRLIFNPSVITGGSWSAVTNAPWVEYNEGVTSITGGTATPETYLPNTADVREFNGSEAFALNGTHMRRAADNASGDSLVFMAKADAGNIDIVSLLAAFNTLG